MEERRCERCFAPTVRAVCEHCGWPVQGHNEPHQLPVGTLLGGRYQIGKVLGQGGFGITYLGWDRQERREVAVKEFFPASIVFRRCSLSMDVECGTGQMEPHFRSGRDRFLREAQALAKLRDLEGVVDILDLLEANGTAYIVMEYIRGRDLRSYVRERGGRLTVAQTLEILRPAMETLAKVHKAGIIHRDIAPDNIILTDSGITKLLDFGAVRTVTDPSLTHDPTSSTEAILKHGFAPLEQYTSRGRLGPWTDEYAMCATVYYCIMGEVPMYATNRLMEETVSPWAKLPGLSAQQRRTLERGFHLRANERYRDMDAFIRDLYGERRPPMMDKAPERGPRVISQGIMDNGMAEIHYVDENGQEMRVYGWPGNGPGQKEKKGLLARLGLGKKKKSAPKAEEAAETVPEIPEIPERRWEEYPDRSPRTKTVRPPRRESLDHQAVVYGLKTDTARYAMDFGIFPEVVWRNPTWEKRLLGQSGARADEIFAELFPGEGGGSRYGAGAFRTWEQDGMTVIRLPDEDEGTDVWCRAYVLRGKDYRDFRFFTVEQTPGGFLVGMVDRDLRHYHMTEAADNMEETLDIIRDLQII